jgi:ferredoxin--NADP+ reductase
MAYVITRACIRAGDCVEACQVACIVHGPRDDKTWPIFYIDPDACIDCGACVPVCPADAIFLQEDVPAEYADDIARNRRFFTEGPGYWAFDLDQVRVQARAT